MSTRRTMAMALLATATLAISACSSESDFAATAPSATSSIASTATAPEGSEPELSTADSCLDLTSKPSRQNVSTGVAGLEVSMPMLAGWTRDSSQDSAIVRYIEVAPQRDASAALTVEQLPTQFRTVQQVLDAEKDGLVSGGGKDLQVRADVVCGLPAETVTVEQGADERNPARTITARIVVAVIDGKYFAVSLVVQPLTRPALAATNRDLQLLLAGLAVTTSKTVA